VASAGIILACFLWLFAGGAVKGLVGLGLPVVGMPLLTLTLQLKTAIAILVVPLVTSNLSQSFEGGLFRWTLKRFWPTLTALFITAAVSTQALVALPERTLFTVAGTAIIVLPLITYFYPELRIGPSAERLLGPCIGMIGGFLGGVSAFLRAAANDLSRRAAAAQGRVRPGNLADVLRRRPRPHRRLARLRPSAASANSAFRRLPRYPSSSACRSAGACASPSTSDNSRSSSSPSMW